MTRINVIPVSELCDQHLLAEHRELTRIPNSIISGKLKPFYFDAPKEYTLGTGHVKFFVDKLDWLHSRYGYLRDECLYRGFFVTDKFPQLWAETSGYSVTDAAIALNRARICQSLYRMSSRNNDRSNAPRWTKRTSPVWTASSIWQTVNS